MKINKHMLIITILAVFSVAHCYSQVNANVDVEYVIERLSSPTIEIGGKKLIVGDRFMAGDKVKWSGQNQWMLVKNTKTSRLVRFSKRTSEKKGFLQCIRDFLIQVNKGSTRGLNEYITLEKSLNSNKFPDKRIALVIGNQNYQNLSSLKSAQLDAEEVSDALSNLGFDVIELYDASFSEMDFAFKKFAKLAEKYDVSLVYYAGHGREQNMISYLVPVEMADDSQNDAMQDCISCTDVVQQVESSGCKSRIFYFDACRDSKKVSADSSYSKHLVMECTPGSVIIFSTRAGEESRDGGWDSKSPFAKAFLRNLNLPLSFPEMTYGLVKDTYFATECRQSPINVGTLLTDFRFNNNIEYNSPLARTPGITNRYDSVNNELSADDLFLNGEYYFYGKNGKSRDYAEAIHWYEQSALKEHVEAIYSLGFMYANGLGTVKDSFRARELYQKAAKKGLAKAQQALGLCFANGEGGEKNYSKALDWFQKAASQGYASAQYNIGILYEKGYVNNKVNYKEALKWYEKAARQEFSNAQVKMGDFYFSGSGLDRKNHYLAAEWYKKAADNGNSDGMCSLGYLTENGFGVPQDSGRAYELYNEAARQGNSQAQYNLGVMYENGVFVPKNLEEAKRWYNLASERGHVKAQEVLTKLKGNSANQNR